MNRCAITLVAAVVLVAGGCGGDGEEETTETTAPPTTTTTTAPLPQGPGMGPLTGYGADPDGAGPPALIVKIDNAPLAVPQAGINQADVVFEEGVEGGVTRFAAVFHSLPAESVGPVRSARSTDIAIAAQLGSPLFAYSGANAKFARLIRQSPLIDAGPGFAAEAYRRQRGRPAPYNLFSSTPALRQREAGQVPPPPIFEYRAPGEPAPEAGSEPAVRVRGTWKDRITTTSYYEWDAAAGGFARTQNGKPHNDAAGVRVIPENVVFQVVRYVNTGLVDRSGAAVPEAELMGEGEAVVLTGGRMIRGRWTKTTPEQPTAYVDAGGAPIRLTPGRTWVELVPEGNLSVG